MSGVQTIIVEGDEDGVRLDRWFKNKFPDVTHGRLQKLLRTGQIRIDGGRVKANHRLAPGQQVRIPPINTNDAPKREAKAKPIAELSDADAAEIKSTVLFKDDHLIAINKPAGLAVQGGSKLNRHVDGMLDALRFGSDERPRLVHRLDKDTSGVLLLARTAKVAATLTAAFRTSDMQKVYWAAVKGVPVPRHGYIDQPLRKEKVHQGERVVTSPVGLRAVTNYRTIEAAGRRAAWLELMPETGRTHQLRVHTAAIGNPILGDGKYGGGEAFLDTDAIASQIHLHARALKFLHPSGSGGAFQVIAPLPPHMLATWRFLGFDQDDLKAIPFQDDLQF